MKTHPRILVTAIGGDLSQSVVKCLRNSGRIPYIAGCDMNPYASGRPDVDRFLQSPPVKNQGDYSRFLCESIEKEKIDYFFPLSDVEIMFFNRNRELFQDLNVRVIANEEFIIDTFMDKYKTVEFFKTHGINYPRTWFPSEFENVENQFLETQFLDDQIPENQIKYPVILKKQKGSGSQCVFNVKDSEELHFYLKRHGDMIIQEYIPGGDNEYTSGIFSDGTVSHVITFRRILAPGGFSQQVELITDETVSELPRKIAETLKFKGSLNVQFRQTPKGGIPFEINPRFSSTVYFRHLFGFKDVQWSLDMLEECPIRYIPQLQKGIGVRKLTEILFTD